MSKRASYREGIEWIAFNDSPADNEPAEQIAGYISTLMLAALFNKDAADVAADVVRYRERHPETISSEG